MACSMNYEEIKISTRSNMKQINKYQKHS